MANPLMLIAPDDAEAIGAKLLARAGDESGVTLTHSATARAKFSRNDVRTIESTKQLSLYLSVVRNNKPGIASTTRTDAEGLAELVKSAVEAAQTNASDRMEGDELQPATPFGDPPIYFESTIAAGTSAVQGDLIREAARRAQAAGLVAAGAVEVTAEFNLLMNSRGLRSHTRSTYAEMTMTARSSGGPASGWAWAGGEDFGKLDTGSVVDRAIALCRRSEGAVAVEPGRYTVILEPEAVVQLTLPMTGGSALEAVMADLGQTVYSNADGGNKIGLKMTDERVQIVSDPTDPDLPFSPLAYDGSLFSRTSWIKNGVLTNLVYEPWYAKIKNRTTLYSPLGRARLDIDGAKQTLDEMIASTKRGIWVHHFGGLGISTGRTLLLTGVTRDGTFLIENGKITKAIKNLRFSESPFFILNKLDAFGPVQRAEKNWAVPRLKVHDFEFTSLSDAI